MKKQKFESKLKTYSALAVGLAAISGTANAQIQYTDINPDVTLNKNDSLMLDLNKDAVFDMKFKNMFFSFSFMGYKMLIKGLLAYGYNNMELLSKVVTNSSGTNYLPEPLNLNDTIGVDQSMWNNSGSSNGNQIPGMLNMIGKFGTSSYSGGLWKGKIDKYLGFRYHFTGDTVNWRYGWVRLDVPNDSVMTVKDYAYEFTMGKKIFAGQMVSGIDDKNPEFKAFVSGRTLFIQDANLGENAILRIFNSNGQVVLNTPVKSGIYEVSLNELPAGIYLINVASESGISTKKVILK